MTTTAASVLWAEIERFSVPARSLAFWWLYQAGIILKSPGGTILGIDPYLSNAAFRSYQQVRAVPPPIDPSEARLSALLATHSHEDHLDPDSIEGFMAHRSARFIGPPLAAAKVRAAGIGPDRVTEVARGDVVTLGDLAVRAVHARHDFGPEPTPDAVGYLIEHGGVRLYHSGDTQYDSEIVADTPGPTASLIAINGTAGNMNAHEAALLAWLQHTHLAVPFHYGLWPDSGYGAGATIDPQIFVDTYHRLDPEGRTLILSAGEPVVLDESGRVA